MCGIYGIVDYRGNSREVLCAMMDRMMVAGHYRGPDQSAMVFVDNLLLGTNRLAIVAPQEDSTVCVSKSRESYAVFNGEIVNHRDLKRSYLPEIPIDSSDSAVILPLYEQEGRAFVHKIAGMFAIALYDAEQKVLQLCRDPFGIKPLYYFTSESFFIFASEIKCIFAALKKAPDVFFPALDQTLRYRFFPGKSSSVPGVMRVGPGEWVMLTDKRIERETYWTRDRFESTSKEQSASTLAESREIFRHVVSEHGSADVPGGLFVSGGLDSSFVASLALSQRSAYQKVLSLRFRPTRTVDEEYGKVLQTHLDVPFEWVEVDATTAQAALEQLSYYLDEPLENPIHVGTYLLAQRAHELGIKSVLTGDGSDEFFLGYDRHKCWFGADRASAPDGYPRWLWTCTPEDRDSLYTVEAHAEVRSLLDYEGRELDRISTIEEMLSFEQVDRLTEYHCMRLDRMTMAWSVEARVPFLDTRVVELARSVSLKNRIGTNGKEYLQKVAAPYVPPEIIQRKKIHFPSLPDEWTSGDGIAWAQAILLDPGARLKPWISPERLERKIREHAAGTWRGGRVLWALLVAELWLRRASRWGEVT